jgi:hypothetical protein
VSIRRSRDVEVGERCAAHSEVVGDAIEQRRYGGDDTGDGGATGRRRRRRRRAFLGGVQLREESRR